MRSLLDSRLDHGYWALLALRSGVPLTKAFEVGALLLSAYERGLKDAMS